MYLQAILWKSSAVVCITSGTQSKQLAKQILMSQRLIAPGCYKEARALNSLVGVAGHTQYHIEYWLTHTHK